jgi:hypothetical protein
LEEKIKKGIENLHKQGGDRLKKNMGQPPGTGWAKLRLAPLWLEFRCSDLHNVNSQVSTTNCSIPQLMYLTL